MNILFVYPLIPETFWSLTHSIRYLGSKAIAPPYALLILGSLLKELRPEWSLRLIDENVCKLKEEDIVWADYIFISAMLIQKDNTQKVIEKCNGFKKPIVAGGPAFIFSQELFTGVNCFFLGEAEVLLKDFLNDLEAGTTKEVYSSLEKADLSKSPPPDLSLIELRDYAMMPIQYSKGCPHHCDFCCVIEIDGNVHRGKSTDQIIFELQALYQAGWKGSVFFIDDNFIGKIRETKEILKKIIQWQKEHNYPFEFITQSSVVLAKDQELMSLMVKAGFISVFIGIETINEASLREVGKTQNTDIDLIEMVNIIEGNGLRVVAGFIVGFDNDNPKIIFDSLIKFIQTTGILTAMVSLLSVLPGTKLEKRLKTEKRLKEVSSEGNTDGSLNFKPVMDEIVLLDGYKKILSIIFTFREYYKRISISLHKVNYSVQRRKKKITKNEIRAFFLSVWKIGILSNSRFLYWKLVIKSIFMKKKGAFASVIRWIIEGEHLILYGRKVIENLNVQIEKIKSERYTEKGC